MTINQALKQKNRLIKEINQTQGLLKQYNSAPVGTTKRYDCRELLANKEKLTQELIELKVKIQKANLPQSKLIVELAELKSMTKQLKDIPVEEGTIVSRGFSDSTVTKEVQLNVIEINNKLSEYERRIDVIQDALDVFNNTSEI